MQTPSADAWLDLIIHDRVTPLALPIETRRWVELPCWRCSPNGSETAS
jgi:hypothetical protein